MGKLQYNGELRSISTTTTMPEEQKPTIERKVDRRKRPTPLLSRYTFVGRRRTARRKEEQYNYYVDRLGGKAWAIIGIVVILSISDSVFTLHFLSRGFREINPLMNVAIIIGKPAFIISKYIFTIIGILVLGLHKNFRFVKELMTIIITFYILLNSYHIYLLIQ